jgi:hypothetical protein
MDKCGWKKLTVVLKLWINVKLEKITLIAHMVKNLKNS